MQNFRANIGKTYLGIPVTVRFLIHGRHARNLLSILTRFLARLLNRVFGQGLGTENTASQFYWGRETQFYSITGPETYSFTILLGRRKTRKKLRIKNPMYQKSDELQTSLCFFINRFS